MSWKLLSVLLQYPDDSLLEALTELDLAAAQLRPVQRTPVEGFLAYLHATPCGCPSPGVRRSIRL